MFKLTVKFRN